MQKKIPLWLLLPVLFISCKPSSENKVSSTTEKEPLSVNWSKDVPAKQDILNGWAVTYKDEIYVLTGQEGRFMKYNPATYNWVDLAGLPGPRTETAMALWEDKIVVAGGVNDSMHFMRRVDYYDLIDHSWKFITSLPMGRSRFSLLVYDNKLFATGGVCGDDEQFNTNCSDILYFDPVSKSWKVQTKLTTGRYSHVSLLINNRDMYMIGGYAVDNQMGTLFLDHAKKEFGFKPEIPLSRGNFGGIAMGDYILTFGGKTKTDYSPMEKFDTKTNKWTDLGNCPFWTDRFAYARWKDRIYVFGGSQFPKQVWKGDIIFK